MFKFLTKRINKFAAPSAEVIAQREIEDYERELLAAQARASYEAKMVEYYSEGIKRLSGFRSAPRLRAVNG